VPIALATGAARPDLWLPALAPSLALRRWYAEHPGDFTEFARRYEQELDHPDRAVELRRLLDLAAHRPLVLQAATRPAERGHAAVLARRLLRLHAADHAAAAATTGEETTGGEAGTPSVVDAADAAGDAASDVSGVADAAGTATGRHEG
jgi:uncharacterized protein YeaO (DUF488 family)